MHLAAALRIPVVAIFGPTDPARNGPFGTRSIDLRSPASPTSHKRHARPDEGLLEITREQVLKAARQLLRSPRASLGGNRTQNPRANRVCVCRRLFLASNTDTVLRRHR